MRTVFNARYDNSNVGRVQDSQLRRVRNSQYVRKKIKPFYDYFCHGECFAINTN